LRFLDRVQVRVLDNHIPVVLSREFLDALSRMGEVGIREQLDHTDRQRLVRLRQRSRCNAERNDTCQAPPHRACDPGNALDLKFIRVPSLDRALPCH
jgi:hypothetical protein